MVHPSDHPVCNLLFRPGVVSGLSENSIHRTISLAIGSSDARLTSPEKSSVLCFIQRTHQTSSPYHPVLCFWSVGPSGGFCLRSGIFPKSRVCLCPKI